MLCRLDEVPSHGREGIGVLFVEFSQKRCELSSVGAFWMRARDDPVDEFDDFVDDFASVGEGRRRLGARERISLERTDVGRGDGEIRPVGWSVLEVNIGTDLFARSVVDNEIAVWEFVGPVGDIAGPT